MGLHVQQRHGGRAAPGRRALQLHGEPAARVRRRQPGGQAELLDLEEVLLRVAPYLHARHTSSRRCHRRFSLLVEAVLVGSTPKMEVATHTDMHTHSIRDSRNQDISVVTCTVVLVRTCSSIFFQSRPNLHRKKERKNHGHQPHFLLVAKERSRDSDTIQSTSCSECSSPRFSLT